VPPLKISVSLFLLMLSALCLDVAAQEGSVVPADDFDRGTPLRSADGFQAAVDEGNYEVAAEYLDLRNLRGAASELTGEQLARRFFVIFKRAAWVDIDELVDDPAGRSNDNLPDYRDSIGVVLTEGKETRLLMQKVPRGDGEFIWKVSNATVSLVPELYDIYGYPEVVEKLRRSLPNVTILGFELFKLVIVIVAGIFAYLMVFLVALATRRMLGDPHTPSHRRVFRYLAVPVGVWAVIIATNAAATSLGTGVTAEAWRQVTPIPILVTVWVMFGGINLLRDIYANRLQQRERPGAAVLLRPAGNAIKLLIGAGATLFYLDQIGINITTMLAGLGVGGIAVALALQKPMEDVFGAITLYTQQPVRVGDFCRFGTATGTIEEIGLRTTRVRTLADTVIAVPNARLANEPIDNISAREKVLYNPILRLRYDTSPEQLRQILDGIRDLFATHEQVLKDDHRVRFNEIADDALLVEAYAYIDTTDWCEYLQLAEELNIRVLEIVAQAGTSLSLPARSLHIEHGTGDAKVALE
jgi:MscS family membrane protein